MDDRSLHTFIIERLPDIDGYGDTGKIIDEDGVSNHAVFKQSIRENKEGDVGVFVVSTQEDTKLSGHSCYQSEIQVVVNCVQGGIDGAIDYLSRTLENIRNNIRNDYIWVKSCKLINIRPVGKNQAGIHWCVLNVLLKYIVNTN